MKTTKIRTSALPVRMGRRTPGDGSIMTISQGLHRFPLPPESPKFQKLQRPTEFTITLSQGTRTASSSFWALAFVVDFPWVPVGAFMTLSCPLVESGSLQQRPTLPVVHSTSHLGVQLNQDGTLLIKYRSSVPGT